MRIVFDAFWWISGPASVRHVLRETVLAWHERFPEDEITLVVRRRHREPAELEVGGWARVCPSRVWPHAVLATVSTALVARRTSADVIVTQNFVPPLARALRTVYLHDVLFMTNPEWFGRAERAYFSFMPLLDRHADVIFTSSRNEAERVRANLRPGTARIAPVGLGLSSELMDGSDADGVPGLVPSSFLLTVGRLNVRKNLLHVVETCVEKELVSRQFPLVVVGKENGKPADLSPAVMHAVRDRTVVFTGFVEESQLRWLYRNTRLFLYLSLDEGFGMPPLEAAAFGADLIVSDIPVMRENLENMATFVDPLDRTALADAIEGRLKSAPGSDPRPDTRSLVDAHSWWRTVGSMRAVAAESLPAGRDRDRDRDRDR